MAQAEQQRDLLAVVEVPEVVEPLDRPMMRVDVALAAEAEEVLFVDGVEEHRRHGLDRQTVELRGEPQPLDGGPAPDVPRRFRTAAP